MIADELGQAVGDAVFGFRNDGGVRDLQPQRMPKQRHHGKPVGNGTDGGGLANRPQPAPAALAAHEVRQRQPAQGQQQQPHGKPFRTLEPRGAWVA